jgi:hypothetical protein
MTSYSIDGVILLIVDTENTGSVTININSIGNVILKKSNTSGALVNMESGDLKTNTYYFLVYDGTNYVLITAGGGSSVTAISGSGVMSNTTGSSVIHNVSGVTSGSYNIVEVDTYGHVTSGSIAEYYTIWMPDAPPASPSADDDEFSVASFDFPSGWTPFDPGSSIGDCYVKTNGLILGSYNDSAAVTVCGMNRDPAAYDMGWTKVSINSGSSTGFYAGMMLNYFSGSILTVGMSSGSMNSIRVDTWASDSASPSSLFTMSTTLNYTYLMARYNSFAGRILFYCSDDGVGWRLLYQKYQDWPMYMGPFTKSEVTVPPATYYSTFKFFRFGTFAYYGPVNGNRVKVYK